MELAGLEPATSWVRLAEGLFGTALPGLLRSRRFSQVRSGSLRFAQVRSGSLRFAITIGSTRVAVLDNGIDLPTVDPCRLVRPGVNPVDDGGEVGLQTGDLGVSAMLC
jgi:hypothetical protein